MSKHKQANGEIHEDQLLNFLVNTLTGAFGLTLGENADLDLEDIRHSKRFGIEATYRLSESSLISTTTKDPARRFLFVVISLLAQNVWRYLHWEYVATPRRGGRRLWWWPFEEFIRMVTRAAWNALSVRRTIPSNRPPDDRFER